MRSTLAGCEKKLKEYCSKIIPNAIFIAGFNRVVAASLAIILIYSFNREVTTGLIEILIAVCNREVEADRSLSVNLSHSYC